MCVVAQFNITGLLGNIFDGSLEPLNIGNANTQLAIDGTTMGLLNPQFNGGSGINWNIIDAHEGENWLNPYVPFSAAAAADQKSGITIGIGVDLANGINQSIFASLFKNYVDDQNLEYLYKATSKLVTGDQALQYLEQVTPTSPDFPYGAAQTIITPNTFNSAWTAIDPASVSVSITQSRANILTNWACANR
jgi:hypothetical protein